MTTTLTADTGQPAGDEGAYGHRAPKGRLLGIDAVRALAIFGMVFVHVNPTGWLHGEPFSTRSPALEWLGEVVSGRAMSLFVLLAGVSVALMTGGSFTPTGQRLSTARRRLAVRAAALLLIGLGLEEIVEGSIISFYALWLLLLLPLLRLRAKPLFIAAAVLTVASPAYSLVVQNWGLGWISTDFMMRPGFHLSSGFGVITHPGEWPDQLRSYLLVGGGFQTPYAVPLLLAGLEIGRLDLHNHAVHVRMLLVGAIVAAGAYLVSWLTLGPLGGGHALDRFDAAMQQASGPAELPPMPWETLLAMPPRTVYAFSATGLALMIGLAIMLLGGLVMVLERRGWQRALWPLAATGGLSLTWYAGHMIALELIDAPLYSFGFYALFVAVALAFSVG